MKLIKEIISTTVRAKIKDRISIVWNEMRFFGTNPVEREESVIKDYRSSPDLTIGDDDIMILFWISNIDFLLLHCIIENIK